MLLNKREDSVQSGGLQETGTFTIKAGPKAFDILSSNLYQNKILAVIREISCNAADAHKMAGRPLSEIVVRLPTFADPIFSVRDYGPSMSHSQIMRLYTSYFDSTKDGDNDAIGGFGLGSKSPFSLTDQFTVRAWQDGNVRTYAMYKVDGVPTVSLISSEPSTGRTGIEVSLTVDSSNGNLRTWSDEARNYFRWWPTPPTFERLNGGHPGAILTTKNFASVSATVRPDGLPHWAVLSAADYVLSQPHVFMGLVPYSLNLSALARLDKDAADLFANLPLVLIYDVGAVEISPSRETLSYTQATIQTIVATLKDVARNLLSGYRTALDKAPDLYTARHALYGPASVRSMPNARLRQMFRQSNPTWRGKSVGSIIKFDLASILNPASTDPAKPNYSLSVTTYRRAYYGKTWRRDGTPETGQWPHRVSEYHDPEIMVHAETITGKVYAKIQQAAAQPDNSTNPLGGVRSVQIVSGAPYAVVAAAVKEVGLPPLIDVTTLPDVPSVAGSTTTRTTTKGYEASLVQEPGGGRTYWKDWSRTETDLDLTTGGLYVEFFDGQPTTQRHTVEEFLRCGWFVTPPRLIGIPRRYLGTKKIQEALTKHKWTPLSDLKSIYAMLATPKIVDCYSRLAVRRLFSSVGPRQTYASILANAGLLSPEAVKLTRLAITGPNVYGPTTIDRALFDPAIEAQIAAAEARVAAVEAEFVALEQRKPMLTQLATNVTLDSSVVVQYVRS